MPAAVFEPVEEVSVEFTPIEEVKPKAISFEPVEEVTPRKNIAQFLAEPDAGVTESSPLTPGALPSVSNNLSTPFPKTEREMIEQQVPENDQPLRIGEQPATLPRFGKKGTVSRGVSDVISGLGEWALNKPEEFAATFTPLAPAIALRYAPEIAQQFAGDVVEGAKGDRQALGRALAMAGLVGIPKGAEVARERWLLSGKAREAVPTPDEAARAGMRPEQPGEPMVRPPQEPLPVKPAPIDFVPEAVVEQPALAKITEEMNAAVDEAAKAGAELPVQHEAVLPGASETFKEITGEEPTTKGAENASSQQSTATLHGPLLRVGESARRENEARLPVNEGGEGVRGNENQRATQTQGEVINLGHERLLPNRPELQTPEEFTAGEIQKLAVSKLGNLDERSPASIVFDISEWTTNAKREAQSIPETFTYSPEGTGKYLIEFPAGTRPKNALESLVEAIKQGDGPGDSWLPLNQYEAIKQAIKRGDPVNSDAAKSYGIRLPKGYTESGGVYWKLDSKEAGKKPTSKPPRTPSVEPPEVSSVRGNEVQEPAVARSEETLASLKSKRGELLAELDEYEPLVTAEQAALAGHPELEGQRPWSNEPRANAIREELYETNGKISDLERYQETVAKPETPAVARSEEAVAPTQAPRDWDAYYEDLVGDLDSFRPARDTGQINYDLEDVAQRFVDYAKADTSGKPLSELVRDFAKADEATPSQIRKLRASVKNLEPKETAPPEVAAAKVESQVREVARTEGQRPAKEVKSELVDRLEQANAEAPSVNDFSLDQQAALKKAQSHDFQEVGNFQYGKRGDEARAKAIEAVKKKRIDAANAAGFRQITIDIPGDGKFTLWNTKESIGEVLESARRIKTGKESPSKPGTGRMDAAEYLKRDVQDALHVYGDEANAYQRLTSQLDRASELGIEEAQQARMRKLIDALEKRIMLPWEKSKNELQIWERDIETNRKAGYQFKGGPQKGLENLKQKVADELAIVEQKLGRKPWEPRKPATEPAKPEIIGMGGAVPSEFGPGSVSSIMFAAIDKDLAEMGKPPMKRGEPRTWDQDMQIATARMNRDPQWIPNLIAEVKDHPRPLSSWETMGMNLQKAYWKAQANDALKRIAQASEDGNQPELVRAKQDAARFEDNILDLYDAVGRGGTGSEAGRSLQAQKIGLTDDLSLVEMRLEARARTKDGKLTPEIEKEVERIHKEYQEKLSKLEKATAEADKRRIDAETRATLAEIARQTAEKKIPPPHIQKLIKSVGDVIHERANAARERLKGKLFTLSPDVLKDLAEIGADNIWTIGEDFGRWSVKMVEDIGERVKPHLQAVWDASKKLIEDTWEGKAGKKSKTPAPPKVIELAKQTIKKGDSTVQQREKLTARIADRYQNGELDKITPSVQKLARTFIQDGIRDREELIDAVHEVIGNKIPEWTRRDTMDAISGYGDYKSLSKDQISVILRDLKGQMQQIAKLEDMASGQAPLRSGLERREVTEAQSKLIKLVNEAKRKGGYETTDPTRQLRTALDEVKKRTASQIAEYERRIAEKDYSVRKSTPVREDAALNQARYELKQVKRKWTTQKKAWDYANRPWWERKLDFVAGLRRFNVLSGPKTLLKLLAYSATKTGTSLSTEIAGAGIQRLPILSRIAQYAPSEGRSSVTDFARSYSKAVTKGMKDAYDVATKHESELKSLYDPRAPEPFHWTQFNGLLHEVEKAPLRRAAFELSKTKRIENAIRRNADVTDDAVMTAIKYEAYQDSQRALLLEDNKLASSIRAMWRTLESKSKATGETSVGGKILATAGRTELPILTVPLNFAKQTIEGALGLPLGLAKVTRAWFKGIDNLADHPAEADAIFRNLKNGSVGGAIALYAFFDGYYGWNNFGGYYEPGEKRKSIDAAFGTIKLGGYNIPSVLLHNPFIEAGMVANTMGRLMSPRKGSKAEPVPAAVVASALGLMEHSPLGTEATSFSEMAVGRDRMNAINKHLASYFTPQFTRNIADWTDSEKRNPKTFTQHIEMGIPGLRQNVPVKRERRP